MRHINREKSPLEIALQSLIIGLSVLFIAVSISLKFLASYIGIEIPIIYLIALAVTLINFYFWPFTGNFVSGGKILKR